MGDLICSAVNCVNNVEGLCSAVNIHVNGKSALNSAQTSCRTFAEKGFMNALSSIPNTNVVGEIKQIFNAEDIAMSPHIICDAVNCRHNSSGLCCAGYIQINGAGSRHGGDVNCETFVQ